MIVRWLLIALLFLFTTFAISAPIRNWPSEPTGKPIDVVYPRETDSLDQVTLARGIDSTFLLGNVANPLTTKLSINGHPVVIDSGGGWIAWLKTPSRYNDFVWKLEAVSSTDTHRLNLPVIRPELSSSIAIPIPLKSPFWATTKAGARFRKTPAGKNILLPMTGTPVRIQANSGSNYYAKLPDGTGVWMDSAKTLRIKKVPVIGNIRKVVIQSDTINREVNVLLVGAKPTPFYLDYANEKKTLTVRFLHAKAKPLSKIAVEPSTGIDCVMVENSRNGVALRLQFTKPDRYLGYRLEPDSHGVKLTVRYAPSPSKDTGKPLHGWKIVVDPGHGGVEYGSIGPTWFAEKTANLDVANRLTKRLLELGAEVKQTRTTDTVMSLTDRVAVAENWQADILLSVHHNALPDNENPWDSTGSAAYYFHPQSEPLANVLYNRLVRRLALPERGVYVGDFAICRSYSQISVLTEAAFMIRPEQERKLRTQEFRQIEAEALAEGLVDFVQQSRQEEAR